MKVIARTDEYTVYQKRSERYAVRKADRKWVNGDEKVAILLQHDLIKAPLTKAPEPEPEAEPAAEAAADDAAEADAAPEAGDAPAE